MKKLNLLLAAVVALGILSSTFLTGCGKDEPRPPTAEESRAEALANSDRNAKLQALLEQQRSTALANISSNVSGYFAANPRFQPASDWSVIPHTDDYIDPACPQGSGWGWANIMSTKIKDAEGKPTKFKVYCSTSSASLGCYIENDFKSGPHAKEAQRCDANLPHPLKPLNR